ncbi:hypothetical protein HY640_00740 [Candidatus Woesearchaeota archaeon]|nr:hypothetical protein [Candidatus Woesearchaeota archaeon]
MLPSAEYDAIRAELGSRNPLFLMHDDPDGLSSFLLLYRYCRRGSFGLVKTTPVVDSSYLRRVQKDTDKVFILDVAMVEQDFIDKCGVSVVWIDHHTPLKRSGVLYFNPRLHRKDAYFPATYVCYKSVLQDLWIAMVGCVGDWFLPEFKDEFVSKYPDLMDSSVSNPDDAMFRSKVGALVRLFSFVLKGRSDDVSRSVKALAGVNSPYDLLEQRTPEARYLYKRYSRFDSQYQSLLSQARSEISGDALFVFTYGGQTSFSSDLANELLYLYPDKFIVIAREKNGEMRMSLRSRRLEVFPRLKRALEGISGYGGGHEYACGANVKKSDFERFIGNLRLQVG